VELWSFVAAIGRHWRLVAPILLVAVLGCGALAATAPPNYEVTGSVVMLLESQKTDAQGRPVNPWGSADSSASQFASLMTDAVAGREFEERVALLGVPETFTLATDAARPAVVTLTVKAPTEAIALTAYGHLRDAFRREVDLRQQALAAPAATRYSAVDLTVPHEARAVRTRVKLAIGLLGLGVLASLAAAAGAELAAAVRRVREEVPVAGTAPAGVPDPVAG
jgi:uncharacterized protein involved in exopolysaccharide biosynthesis